MSSARALIAVERIEGIIIHLRGRKVIIDSDLAKIYGVTTKKLNQAVKRNIHRFPSDFLFQLSPKEKEEVVTICDHLLSLKFSPHLPFAFTEHGAIMAASVLSTQEPALSTFSPRAKPAPLGPVGRGEDLAREPEDHQTSWWRPVLKRW